MALQIENLINEIKKDKPDLNTEAALELAKAEILLRIADTLDTMYNNGLPVETLEDMMT